MSVATGKKVREPVNLQPLLAGNFPLESRNLNYCVLIIVYCTCSLHSFQNSYQLAKIRHFYEEWGIGELGPPASSLSQRVY